MKDLLKQQQEILDKAKAEARNLTPEEDAKFKALSDEIEALAAKNEKDEKDASEKSLKEGVEKEYKRITEVMALCKSFIVDPTEYIQNSKSVSEVKDMLLEKLVKENEPIKGKVADVVAGKDAKDKFRDAVSNGIVYAGIQKGEANEFTGKRLLDIVDDCLEKDGMDFKKIRSMSTDQKIDELMRTFFDPTASFPSIIDEVAKKSIVEPYKEKLTTFQLWTSEGSVNDFKSTPDHEYVMGGGKFEKVPEGGELKKSELKTELLPQRKIDTYGTQFSLTREAFYNDDIGFIAKMPYKYTQNALRTIDEQVYTVLMNNGAIYDGVALFEASNHKNLISTGAIPSENSLNDVRVLMSKQTDQFEKPIALDIAHIIIPSEYSMALYKILNSQLTPGTNNNDANIFFNRPYEVIETPWIANMSGSNAKPWFVVANKNFAKSIQVDYLRGQKTPTFRKMEVAGRLGFVWDIFMDWGVAVVDYRGIYKHVGA